MTLITRFRELYQDLASLQVDDLEGIYHTDIVFQDPVAIHEGIGQVKQYFERLLTNATHCTFTIHSIIDCHDNDENVEHVVVWTMMLKTPKLNNGQAITLDGTSVLKVRDDRICFHRDYYDMGQMIYEHVPILGAVVKKLKKRLAA